MASRQLLGGEGKGKESKLERTWRPIRKWTSGRVRSSKRGRNCAELLYSCVNRLWTQILHFYIRCRQDTSIDLLRRRIITWMRNIIQWLWRTRLSFRDADYVFYNRSTGELILNYKRNKRSPAIIIQDIFQGTSQLFKAIRTCNWTLMSNFYSLNLATSAHVPLRPRPLKCNVMTATFS